MKEIKDVTSNKEPSRIEVFEGGEKPKSTILIDLENERSELGK